MCHFWTKDDADGAKVVEGLQDAHRSLAVPQQSPSARSAASGSLEEEEAAVSNKELGEWLRQHPTYTMDMTGFTPVRISLSFISMLSCLVLAVTAQTTAPLLALSGSCFSAVEK